MIGSFHLPSSASSSSWAPPADWINISSVANNEIHLLVTNGVATSFSVNTLSGTYSIDWGDGMIETSRVSDTIYTHQHSSGGVTCSEGYKTWKVRIYGASSTITRFRIRRHTFCSSTQIIPILWAVFGTTGLTTIESAFYDSSANGAQACMLRSVTFPTFANTTGANSALANCTALVDFQFPNSSWGAITDPVNMFAGCTSLSKLTLPSSWGGVTSLMFTFANCSSLTSLKFPTSFGSITSLYATFQGCSALHHMLFPSSWGSVTETRATFASCFSLVLVSLPAQVSSGMTLCEYMFYKCYNLTTVTNLSKVGSNTIQSDFNLFMSDMDFFSSPIQIGAKLTKLGIFGSAGALLKITSIRLLATGSAFTGSSPQVDVSYTSLNASALNILFIDLPTIAGKTINIMGCPGAATCTRSTAINKGWTIIG